MLKDTLILVVLFLLLGWSADLVVVNLRAIGAKLGIKVFFLGLLSVVAVGASKLIAIWEGVRAPLVTSSPYFYLALVAMIIGTQMFLTGFVAELVTRNANERNNYKIEKEL